MLEGSIPSELGELSQVGTLLVSKNAKLEGTIPSELATCTQLENFAVSFSSVSGTIPESFADLAELRDVRIECTDVHLPAHSLCNHSATIYLSSGDQAGPTSCSCCDRGDMIAQHCDE